MRSYSPLKKTSFHRTLCSPIKTFCKNKTGSKTGSKMKQFFKIMKEVKIRDYNKRWGKVCYELVITCPCDYL